MNIYDLIEELRNIEIELEEWTDEVNSEFGTNTDKEILEGLHKDRIRIIKDLISGLVMEL